MHELHPRPINAQKPGAETGFLSVLTFGNSNRYLVKILIWERQHQALRSFYRDV